MIGGLALGETKPGPLIMVGAFVGFIGASTQQVFGPDLPLAAGIGGGRCGQLFTFLPSFLFILCGAALVEATHGDLNSPRIAPEGPGAQGDDRDPAGIP